MDKDELIQNTVAAAVELYGDKDAYKMRQLKDKMYVMLKDCTITETGTQITVSDTSWIFYVKKFMVCKKIEGLSDSSIKNYYASAKQFFAFLGNKPLNEITTDDVRAFLAYKMSTGSGKSHADNVRRNLSTFFTWCENEELIRRNPIKKIKPISKLVRVREPFTEVEIEKMRNYLTDKKNGLRDRALIELLLSTGCRISEAINIKMSDLDLPAGQIYVLGKGDKERIVFLNEKSKYYIGKYLKEGNRSDECPYLFQHLQNANRNEKHLQISGAEIKLRQMGRELGIKIFPHRFRHTAATWALQRGMPVEQVQKMLGHEKIDTTLIYAKLNMNDLAENHRKYMQ